MYDGTGDIQDEVEQNARDQQHPVTFQEAVTAFRLAPTQEIPALLPGPVTAIPGLSTRQVQLIYNNDTLNGGAARERRLGIIDKDMADIRRFLPRLEEVRAYLATMPTDEDEALAEAKNLSDMKLRGFERDVTSTLRSLETELELKKVTV